MAENTKIEWADRSASPWTEKNGTRVMSASFAKNCRRWNADAKKRGVIETVFPSICDPFENWQERIHTSEKIDGAGNAVAWWRPDIGVCRSGQTTPGLVLGERLATMDDLRRDLFALIDECQNIRFLLLTKRPENVRRMWQSVPQEQKIRQWGGGLPGNCGMVDASLFRPNVTLITSVSDQATTDAMIPSLLGCRDLCPILGVSAEPLLGPIDLEPFLQYEPMHENYKMTFGANEWRGIGWVIVGGESGHGARPCNLQWIRSIRDQCKEAGVPCFIKQLGSSYFDGTHNNTRIFSNDKKGGDWNEWPEDLRVREYPWEV